MRATASARTECNSSVQQPSEAGAEQIQFKYQRKQNVKKFIDRYFLLIVVAAFLLIYLVSGLRLCSVESGSMEPTIPTGSLCVVSSHAKYENIELGDVVVYIRKSDNKRIIHRVVEITEEGMITKGDANSATDGLSVTADNLYAKELLHIPYLGRISMAVHNTTGRIIIIILALGLIALEIFTPQEEKKKDETGE